MKVPRRSWLAECRFEMAVPVNVRLDDATLNSQPSYVASKLAVAADGGGGGASGKEMSCMASQSSVGIISIASQGQPSRKAPSGPLLVHFWQPMQRYGSTSMRPKGGWSGSDTQNMQASIGQYSIQAGAPAEPAAQAGVIGTRRGLFFW